MVVGHSNGVMGERTNINSYSKNELPNLKYYT